MIDINRFKKVGNPDLKFDTVKIKTHVPAPVAVDYKKGYIPRYFIQKANDTESQIYEVDFIGFSKVIDNPFFAQATLNWRLKGSDDEIKNSNYKAIKLVLPKIPKLNLYLPNLLQFKEKKDLEI